MFAAMRRILTYATLAALLPITAPAQQLEEGLESVTFLKGWRQDDGSHIGAVEIRLQPKWKTYWRVAGGGGIPPQFDWTGSSNIASVDFIWPTPDIFNDYGYQSVGYEDTLVLPIVMHPETEGAEMSVAVNMTFGVCEEVCIPVEHALTAELPQRLGFDQDTINTALSTRAITGADVPMTAECDFASTPDGMAIGVEIQAAQDFPQPALVFMEYEGTGWMAQRETHHAGTSLHSSALYYTDDIDSFNGKDMLLTVLSQGRAYEIAGC